MFLYKSLRFLFRFSLDVISDMLFNSKFLTEDIEKEKGVIVEEINMSEDSPEDVLSDLHSKAIWGEDAISLPILGTEETVKSFNREQIIKYISSYYIPENSVISISGKFDTENIEKLVEKYFGNWNSSNKKITKYSKPEILSSNLFKKKSIEQLHISLGIPGIETGSEDLYSLLLLSNVFGGGASSILFQKIREEKGLCYSIYSYISAFINTGVVNIYTSLNPKYAADALNMIKEEINKFVQIGISDDKLAKAKEQLKGSYILGLESTSSRMFSNGKSVLFLNKIKTPKDLIEKINRIDRTKLDEVMEKTFAHGIINSSFVGENVDMDLLNNILQRETMPFKNEKSKLV